MFLYAILILLPAILAANPLNSDEDVFFQILDADKDGTVSKAEMDAFNMKFDSNKDGDISMLEYVQEALKLNPAVAANEIALYEFVNLGHTSLVTKYDRDAKFMMFDVDKNGKIEKSEFHTMFEKVVINDG